MLAVRSGLWEEWRITSSAQNEFEWSMLLAVLEETHQDFWASAVRRDE